MARYLDKDGFWVDDEEEEQGRSFYESLVPSMNFSDNQAWQNPQGNSEDAASVLARMVESQARIETYTAEMTANVDVSSSAGQDALRALLGDPMQDKEVRAGAAQALYPGMQAGIGPNGEMSFSAKPGSDIGYDYGAKAQTSNPERAARGTPAFAQFNAIFESAQNMTDINELADASTQLAILTNQFAESRKAQYESQLKAPLGLDRLEKAIVASRKLDAEYMMSTYGSTDMGDSNETLTLLQQRDYAQAKLDEQVSKKLSSDPEVIAIQSRLNQAQEVIKTRTGGALDGTNTAVGMVLPETTDAALLGAGFDPATATPAQRQTVNMGIVTGDKQWAEALEIGQASPRELMVLAASTPGRTGIRATKMLESQFETPELAKQIVASLKNFETAYPNAGPDYSLDLGAGSAGLSKDDKAAAQREVLARRATYVIDQVNTGRKNAFEQSVAQWDTPQSELIAAEWAAQVEIQNAEATPTSPVTIQKILANLPETFMQDAGKRAALVDYVVSQSGRVSDSKILGPTPGYSDPATVRGIIEASLIGSMRDRRYQSGPVYEFAPL